MADTFRYRFGETNPVQAARKAGATGAVEIGDLCWLDDADGYTVKPAGQLVNAWADLGGAQSAFVAKFLGVSGQRWDGTTKTTGSSDGDLRIDTEGIFEFDCAAGSTFNVGDLVGPALIAAGNGLESQKVVKVTPKANAVGRVERKGASVSKILVRIFTAKVGVLTN